MLKQRIVATLIIKNDIVVQSIGFEKYLPIGNINIAVEALNDWGIDELIILDIDASKQKKTICPNMIKELSKYSMVPLSIGGGINTIEDIRVLLHSGADKVSLNQAILNNPSFIQKASVIFGKQCIIISLDIIRKNNEYYVYDYIEKKCVSTMEKYIIYAENLGAGELLINSVDNDGKKCGYDIDMINQACSISTIPIIAQGGAKDGEDLKAALNITKLSGVAASNLFHYTEHSVTLVKSFIKKDINYPIRLESNIKYKDNDFDKKGRLIKKSDEALALMSFKIHVKEII
jgi:cyclase